MLVPYVAWVTFAGNLNRIVVRTPEDVALATLFLASEASSWLMGLTVDVAGGRISL